MRLISAVSKARPAVFAGLNPTTNAWAGRAMVSSVMKMSSTVPGAPSPPKSAHKGGQASAVKTPASAAVTGEGVRFKSATSRQGISLAIIAPKRGPLRGCARSWKARFYPDILGQSHKG